ncbi:MAG: hypothetical protein U0573_08160 [Phycisphaerales bacterium]|nr:hypothetical protein [Planctomycetota bacterium]
MDRSEQKLKDALAGTAHAPPRGFLEAVQARRRRVLGARAVALGLTLLIGAGLWCWRMPPGREPEVTAVSMRAPSALRRLRELPPEAPPGPGYLPATRARDFRKNPEQAVREM